MFGADPGGSVGGGAAPVPELRQPRVGSASAASSAPASSRPRVFLRGGTGALLSALALAVGVVLTVALVAAAVLRSGAFGRRRRSPRPA